MKLSTPYSSSICTPAEDYVLGEEELIAMTGFPQRANSCLWQPQTTEVQRWCQAPFQCCTGNRFAGTDGWGHLAVGCYIALHSAGFQHNKEFLASLEAGEGLEVEGSVGKKGHTGLGSAFGLGIMGIHGGERWGCFFQGCVWESFEIPISGSRETQPRGMYWKWHWKAWVI